MPPRLFFSIRTGRERTGDMRSEVHPAYLRLHDGIIGACADLGYRVGEVIRPEIYPATADRRALFGSDRPVHLIFKAPEEIRPLKGAYNVGCLLIDRPTVSSDAVGRTAFTNQRRMLALLDEIWVGSRFAAETLARAGLSNVRSVPSPGRSEGDARRGPSLTRETQITWFGGCGRDTSDRPHSGNAPHTLFAASFDTADERADPETLIDAFLDAAGPSDGLVLLCDTADLYDRLRRGIVGRQIAVTSQAGGALHAPIGLVSSRAGADTRRAVLSHADFYVCTCRFSGDNGLLLEAMRDGCIPVVARHSAIAEVIEPDAPLVFASTARGDLHQAERGSCAKAMRQARALPEEVRASLAERAIAAAAHHRSVTPLATRLQALMAGP